MDKASAHRLVENTLQHPFDKGRFAELAKNIFNRFEDKPFTYRGNRIFDAFIDTVKTLERIGKYEDKDGKVVDILIVHLKKETTLERGRTAQRNFIARYLNGSRGRTLKDATLAAFVPPDGTDWRFSFVKMEYKFDKNGKVKEEFTPARRYSFLVGENESSHTAQSCLLPLLLNDQTNPSLTDLEEAFSVEKVTEEFFQKYRELFLGLKESLDELVRRDTKIRNDFETKGIDTANFAKKLLGQIVFLYFLQKKGWFGVKRNKQWGEGSKHFLRELFAKDHGNYDNFFNDILEPLFYEALRLPRPDDDYYSHFDCRIPFLNGGLFDPMNKYDWVGTEILLPDDIFSNSNRTSDSDNGDGVLDIFDRYNFTVNEDEPLEKEVAVDPEMLGKVFENLLEVTDRKSKGAFYTPREIVHYMCQESLVNYLVTELKGKASKEDIETLIKYGETVVENDSHVVATVANKGHETKRYSFKLPESIRTHARLIDEKLATIRVCDPAVGSGAFPVGMMNEIVRTRNALTSYIQSDNKNDSERSPYNFKRQAIQNCLYGVDIESGAVEVAKLRFWLSLVVDEESRETVQPLPNLDYKIVQGDSLLSIKKQLSLFDVSALNKLEKLKPIYFKATDVNQKHDQHKQIDGLIKQIADSYDNFDFKLYFSEVFREEKGVDKGFDVIIGNPPYVQLQKSKGKLGTLYENEGYQTYARTGDIYQLFMEQGCNLLKPQRGILAYITSNSWRQAKYGKTTRNYFAEKHTPLRLLEMGKGVFENVIVDTSILIVRHGENDNIGKAVDMDQLADKSFPPTENLWVSLHTQLDKPWVILSPAGYKIMEKMEAIGAPLKEWDISIHRGILTGYDKAFIIDNATRQKLIDADSKSADIIKPILRGRDMRRYHTQWAGFWLIDTHNGYGDIPPINIEHYPAVKTHLDNFYPQLKKRQDKGITPYNLRHCAYHENFREEKLFWMHLSPMGRFAYDNDVMYCNPKVFIIKGASLKYLCAVLNSNLITWYMKNIAVTTGEGLIQWEKVTVITIPIPKISKDQHRPFIKLVDKILQIKTANSSADTTELETEIDQLVYKLYDLTKEEIALVEKNK